MKQDNLEQFINKNRAAFDDESPPPMVWMNLERDLDEQRPKVSNNREKRIPIMRIMQVAAMFVVVLGVGLLIGLQLTENRLPLEDNEMKEFAETEHYYKNQIDNMMTVVQQSPALKDDQIESDIEALDNVYEELKLELIETGGTNADAIIDAMIRNYRSKIEILETVLDKYENATQEKQINIEDDKIEI